MPDADPKLHRMREEEIREKRGIDILSRLRRALRTLLLVGRSSGDEVAQMLSMNRRTLNRQLMAHGTSFQEVLDEVRLEAACQLLDVTRIPLGEIAASLGYAEPGAQHAPHLMQIHDPSMWPPSPLTLLSYLQGGLTTYLQKRRHA